MSMSWASSDAAASSRACGPMPMSPMAPVARNCAASRHMACMSSAVFSRVSTSSLVRTIGYRNFAIIMLLQLAAAVAVAAIGGLWPAIVSAVMGTLLLNYFSAEPVGSFSIGDPSTLFTLMVFLTVACAVALAVGLA